MKSFFFILTASTNICVQEWSLIDRDRVVFGLLRDDWICDAPTNRIMTCMSAKQPKGQSERIKDIMSHEKGRYVWGYQTAIYRPAARRKRYTFVLIINGQSARGNASSAYRCLKESDCKFNEHMREPCYLGEETGAQAACVNLAKTLHFYPLDEAFITGGSVAVGYIGSYHSQMDWTVQLVFMLSRIPSPFGTKALKDEPCGTHGQPFRSASARMTIASETFNWAKKKNYLRVP
ncbi:hypothetical protein QBC36DRAFT_315935 [Triangularia setosa]|uniref:Uncharacterized protein n=1 Tax=Triangularia setosa TaxID=2587417 RepID=A0AAN7A0Y9_9PEZI|nr:hypothetical protein QBC36DRAFT_315935 [Podospora setosa]